MKRAGFGVLAVLVGGLAGSICLTTAMAQDAAAPLPAVTIAEAANRGLSQSARFSGRLDADKRVALIPRVSGTLLEVDFEPGDLVEEGQVLFRIERDLYEASVQEASGALAAAQAQRDLAEIERDRQRELVSRDASPQANLDNAEATLGRAEGDLIRAQAALETAEINLSYTDLKAPFAGRVGPSTVDVGALISPDTGRLVTLISLDPIHVEFQIPSAVMRNFQEAIAAGQATTESSVTIELANGSMYALPGTIDFVDSEVDAGTDSVLARAAFDNSDGLLLDRELVQVELRSTSETESLAIPQEAIQRDVQGAFVLVVDDSDTVESRRIVSGRVSEGYAAVTQGLEAGERVITEGANKVRPGQQVDATLATPTTAKDG